MSTHYDLIIGTGPGGSPLAYKPAPSSKKILSLARGGYLLSERDNWSSKSAFIDDKHRRQAQDQENLVRQAWRPMICREDNLEIPHRLAAKFKRLLNRIDCEDHRLPTHPYLGKKSDRRHGSPMRYGTGRP